MDGAGVRVGRVAALRADDRQFDALKGLGLGILTWFAVRVAPAADLALAAGFEIVHERRQDCWLDVLAHAFILKLEDQRSSKFKGFKNFKKNFNEFFITLINSRAQKARSSQLEIRF